MVGGDALCKPGEFDVREYVEMMGGINMSLVDKTMFTVDKLAPDAKLILAEDLGSNAMIQLAKTYDFSNIKSCPTLPQQFHFLTAP